MNSFIQKYASLVIGTLAGFDRLVLRGSLRRLAYPKGMLQYLSAVGVLLKDFGQHAEAVTDRVKEASLRIVRDAHRPVIYLPSCRTPKEPIARQRAAEDGVTKGPICTLSCVEPCVSYEIFRNRGTQRLELKPRRRQCLHLYHYFIHPVFGFMSARIQTWFPFNLQVCLNGREWLARQMEQKGLAYQRHDNCFVWLQDPKRAQRLMERQLRADWPKLLQQIARRLNPAHSELFAAFPLDYYWTVHQSEWATDIMFRDAATLAELYPRLVHHAMTTFSSPDLMRFLGRKVPAHGHVHRGFEGEVVTDLKHRPEGVRLKHRVDGNSVKLYDKQGSVLRPECTIHDPSDFKVFRRKEGDPDGPRTWRPLRKGIADICRRAEVSQAANQRYLEALASASDGTALHQVAEPLCRPTSWNGRRVRALNPWSRNDAALLQAVSRAEFCLNGLRNRDLCALLFPSQPRTKQEARRRSAATTRKLRLLRAHRILRKVPKTHRYVVTTKGRTALTALLTAREANTENLTQLAA